MPMGPAVHKTVTMTGESTLHKRAMQTRCMCDPNFCGQVIVKHIAPNSPCHPSLETQAPSGRKLTRQHVRDQKNPALKFWRCSIDTFCIYTVVCHQRTRDCFCRWLDISLWAIFDAGADRRVKL